MSSLGNRGQVRIETPTPLQQTIARRAAEARATIPHIEFRRDAAVGEERGTEARLLSACASALRAVPRANGAWRDGRFELYSRVNVGLVVETDEGFVTPTVFDADTKSLAELGEEIERLRTAGRSGALAPPAFAGATFTLWRLAGVDSATIIPSHAAAIAAGAVRRQAVTLTLACDARILYGSLATSFLDAICRALEDGVT